MNKLVAFGAVVLLASCSSPETAKVTHEHRESSAPFRARGELKGIQVTASVEAVDLDQRLLTLKSPGSKAETFRVSEDVKRLKSVKAGDSLTATYQVSATAELREPTAEEKAAPLTVGESLSRWDPHAPPAATMARAIRMVTTIQALHDGTRSITIRGPLGHEVTAPVESAAVYAELKKGQSIVVFFSESLTLSVSSK